MPDFNQIAFSGGAISETAWGRADIEKYSVGLAESLNMVSQVQGSVLNRGGFEFVDECITDTDTVRLIKFQFNNDDAYILEFTANRIRFLKDSTARKSLSGAGGYIVKQFNFTGNPGDTGTTTKIEASDLEASNGDEIEFTLLTAPMEDWYTSGYGPKLYRYSLKNRTDINKSIDDNLTPNRGYIDKSTPTQVVVDCYAHGYSNGDHVYLTGLLDENGNAWTEAVNSSGIPLFQVLNSTADTFELGELDGTNVDATTWALSHSNDITVIGTIALPSGSFRHRTFDLADKSGADVDSTVWGAFNWSNKDEVDWIYTVATPYAEADLERLAFVQTANILTIVHRDYPVKELTRTADTAWTFTNAVFDVTMPAPTNLQGNPNSRSDARFFQDNADGYKRQYILGFVPGSDVGLLDMGFILDITQHATAAIVTTANGISAASPSAADHNLAVGDIIMFRGFQDPSGVDDPWTILNGRLVKVATVTPTTFTFTDTELSPLPIPTDGMTNAYTTDHTNTEYRDYAWCEMPAISRSTGDDPAILSLCVFDSVEETAYGPWPWKRTKPLSVGNDQKIVMSGVYAVAHDVIGTGIAGLNPQGAWSLNGGNVIIRNKSETIPNVSQTESGGHDGWEFFELYFTTGAVIGTDTDHFLLGHDLNTGEDAWFGTNLMKYAVTAVSKRTGEESLAVEFPVLHGTDPTGIASDDPSINRPFTLTWNGPATGDVDYYNVYRWQNGVYGFIGITDPANLGTTDPFFQDINFSPELGDTPPENPVRNPFQKKITGIDIATSIITSVDHEWDIGDRVQLDDILGTTQLNDQTVYISPNDYTADQYKIRLTFTGNDIDMTALSYGTYISGGYAADWPGAVGYHSQRRGFASQFNKRQTVHWSATGLDSVFSAQENAFSYTVTESGANEIRHIITGRGAFLFTSGSVISSSSGDAGFSLENVSNREQTNDGISYTAKPIKMRDSVIYVQDSKSHVYDMSYSFETDSFGGDNLTILVPHIIETETIDQWAFQHGPEPIVWCIMSDGSLKSMTYDKQNRVFAWSEHEFAVGLGGRVALFEAVSVIPEDGSWSAYFQVKIYDGAAGWRKWIVKLWNRQFVKVQDCKFLDGFQSMEDGKTNISNVTEEASSKAVKVTATAHGRSENDIIEIDDVVGATELNLKKYRCANKQSNEMHLVLNDSVTNAWDGLLSTGLETIVTHHANLNFISEDDLTAVFFEATGIPALDDLWHICQRTTSGSFKVMDWAGTLLITGGTPTLTFSMTFATIIDKADISPYISGGVIRLAKKTWTTSATTSYSLNHLNGMSVNALVDGNVEEGLTVTDGAVTLGTEGARVTIGLPYTSRIQTLPLNTPQAELNGRIRALNSVTCRVYRSRGLEFGQTLDKLVALDSRSTEAWNEAANYYDGELSLTLKPFADEKGQLYVQQTNPLPMTLQNIGLNFDLGEE